MTEQPTTAPEPTVDAVELLNELEKTPIAWKTVYPKVPQFFAAVRQLAVSHETVMATEMERDNAIRESNRRDDKWKAGIQEECGCKIEFDPLRTDRATKPGPPTLGEFVRSLKARLDEYEKPDATKPQENL